LPIKAPGPAAGLTGLFGYVFGSAIAGTGVGWIADRWDWNGVFIAMVACCALAIFFLSLTLGHRTASAARG
jgi:OPA family glycerol-3-phosphate transporter-like MFS transporter